MKQAWEDLGSDYADSSTILIGDVDCTQQQSVCSSHGVRGYPTIKSFKAGEKEGQKYSGGRSKDALKAFVDSNLV